jgi:uncharacterized SAM-binding protein YcdF (DUF218 family)
LVQLRLITKKNVRVPTALGWAILALLIAIAFLIILPGIQSFLAVSYPNQSEVMVVEGWLPDFALEQALREFNQRHCRLMLVTGGPIEQGHMLVSYKNFAELAAAILEHLGLDRHMIREIPAPDARRDRTYASAIALKNWLNHAPVPINAINLVSLGTHARRSRLLFEKALGPGIAVGVIAVPDRRYDPRAWWKSSMGVRSTLDELIAYLYARFLFWDFLTHHPDPQGRSS